VQSRESNSAGGREIDLLVGGEFIKAASSFRRAALYGHRFSLPQSLATTTESGKNGIEKLRGETLNVWTGPVLAHAAGSLGFVEMHPPA
jgi:hypothetical protein